MVWTADDSKIISAGMDGAVYEWDAFTGKRGAESVDKKCSYTGVAVTPDGKNTFAVGSDKSLREISDSMVKMIFKQHLLFQKIASPIRLHKLV